MKPRLALNLPFSYPRLSSAVITCICHHVWYTGTFSCQSFRCRQLEGLQGDETSFLSPCICILKRHYRLQSSPKVGHIGLRCFWESQGMLILPVFLDCTFPLEPCQFFSLQ
jgi:hypothetical protein